MLGRKEEAPEEADLNIRRWSFCGSFQGAPWFEQASWYLWPCQMVFSLNRLLWSTNKLSTPCLWIRHTLVFFPPPKDPSPPISPACSASKLQFGYFVFYSYLDAKPLFFAIFNRCFALEILKQCQATESKQGKKFPNNDQKGNPLCLLACFSTFKMLLMPSR